MSIATQERPPTATAREHRPAHERSARPAAAAQPAASAPTAPHCRTLFVVPFRTAMSDAYLHRLAAQLNMATHLHPKLHASPTSPGIARLDFDSGLFLLRGAGEDEWRLEARTWGTPPQQSIHGWHLLAADTARQLDAGVPVPARLAAPPARTARRGDRGRRRRRRGERRS